VQHAGIGDAGVVGVEGRLRPGGMRLQQKPKPQESDWRAGPEASNDRRCGSRRIDYFSPAASHNPGRGGRCDR
jgi:hypothetical protein